MANNPKVDSNFKNDVKKSIEETQQRDSNSKKISIF
jgi:hypothetical protein